MGFSRRSFVAALAYVNRDGRTEIECDTVHPATQAAIHGFKLA